MQTVKKDTQTPVTSCINQLQLNQWYCVQVIIRNATIKSTHESRASTFDATEQASRDPYVFVGDDDIFLGLNCQHVFCVLPIEKNSILKHT